MREATLKRLLLALAALAVVYGGVRLGSHLLRPRADSGGELAAVLAQIAGDSIREVLITPPAWMGAPVVTLSRAVSAADGSAVWTVNGKATDESNVESTLQALRAGKVTDLVAQSATSHARLGVTSDSAWTVVVRGARGDATVLVGNPGRGYDRTHLRLPSGDDVHEVSGGLRFAVANPPSHWRNKVVARVDTAAVRTLVIERDRTEYRVARSDSVWSSAPGGGGSVEGVRIVDVLGELARFDAVGTPDDTVAFAGRERRRVLALGGVGDTLALVEFAGDSTRWLARARGHPDLFEVSGYRVDRVTPRRGDVIRR
jgi:hypothetical protein